MTLYPHYSYETPVSKPLSRLSIFQLVPRISRGCSIDVGYVYFHQTPTFLPRQALLPGFNIV